MPSTRMIVRFKVFRGMLAAWDQLLSEAAEFATKVGPERLITISQNDLLVAVWYWAEPDEAAG